MQNTSEVTVLEINARSLKLFSGFVIFSGVFTYEEDK